MRKITSLITLLIVGFYLSLHPLTTALAATAGTGGGTCDLSEYKNSLYITESSCCGGYTAVNSICATGRYQFMPTTVPGLQSYTSASPNCKQMCSKTSGFTQCEKTQEAVMDEFTMKNLNYIKTSPKCQAARDAVASGKIVTGYKVPGKAPGKVKCDGKTSCTCPVTWSGLLAGAHIGGAGGICNTLSSGKDVDDGATSRLFYVCEHGGYPVPETDCTPNQYGTEGGVTINPGDYTPWEGFTPPAGVGMDNFNSLGLQLKYIWVAAFQQMTSQLTTFMMQQVEIIGTFFDAKHQLETQRLMQEKAAKAHKDYHPSVQMCEIGTFVRNLTNSEKRSDLTKSTLSQSMMDRALATGDSKTSDSDYDDATKTRALIDKFCSKADNAGQNEALCEDGTYEAGQINADINFTQSIDAPLTLDINLLDNEIKPDEENIFAFLDYIFMHEKFPWMSQNKTTLFSFVGPYQDMRSVIAMRSVAQNSFAEIIAQKTAGPDGENESAGPFIKALMREMGMEDADIEATIGENPSYYAQMEMLTKRIYQHPEFISNLYDKPANVKRIRAAMTAIKLMQDRDIHDALMRREMLMSILLELQLRQKQDDILNKSVKPALTDKASEPLPVFDGGESTGGGAGGTF